MEILDAVQRNRAVLEDDALDLLVKNYDAFVMHGGTAVWRCYGGNRFSRDLDFYSNLDASEESRLQKEIHELLVENDYPVREEKYNNKTNTLHIIFRGNGTTGKFDITFGKADGHAVEYMRVDGSRKMILALGPGELLVEKIDTYLSKYVNGAEEIHDLYDIMVLKDKIGKPSKEICRKIDAFLTKIKDRPPKNEKDLRQLILSGAAPSFKDMIGILERWLDEVRG